MMIVKLGVGVFLLSFVVLIVSLLIPGALTPFGSLYCKAGEQFTGAVQADSSGNKSWVATLYNCVDAQGNARSVTRDVSGSTTLAFLALLFGGMGLIVVGGLRNANQMKAQGIETPSSSAVLRFGGQDVPLADLKSSGYRHVASGEGKRSLADTLSQLQEAQQKGLIDSDEYGRLRQEALDKLV